MKILQDTRETKPLDFGTTGCPVTTKKLDVGDYAVEFKDGYVPPVRFERKALGDLFGTMGGGYKRFKKKMIEAQTSNLRLIIIIEVPLSRVLKGYEHSSIEGLSLVYKLFTLWIKHGVMTVYCRNRTEMKDYILHTFIAYGKEYLRRKGVKRL
jgi:ERCC4-type nuclease